MNQTKQSEKPQLKTEALPSINLHYLTPPCAYSGDILKLKSEWVFADYHMSLQELRLIYYVINRFDVSEYFAKDGRFLSSSECYDIHKHGIIEHRSILLPLTDIHTAISCDSKSKSYSPIINAANSLVNKEIRINHINKPSEAIKVVEYMSVVKCPDSKLKCLLLSFSEEFMSFIVGMDSYRKVNLSQMLKFKSSMAMRYYHWMIHSLKGDRMQAQFAISIDTLRNRFAMEDDIKQKHFYKRAIEKPLAEVMELTELKIEVEKVVNKQKRGYPLERVIFRVKDQRPTNRPDCIAVH
ncbi:RepB family plasmid replication initiator protein [Vibrio lentus]|uniref:replication initiation protein n=1 Tax=Vibrio lentus TaxID=136468 RepID=UPI000C858346|nr:replication initiation protein [Vibrio lentus]PMI42460.1 hypothetical protein BCU45_18255 [Vibrio lentus]PMJ57832.1 hypothetical protein BCU20_16825 [Vibrio lentus]